MADRKKLRFISIDENGIRAAQLGAEWAKWILEVLRNFVVVAFLLYIAQKSGKWYMWLMAGIGFLALYQFVMGYIGQSQFNFWDTKGLGDTILKLALMATVFVVFGVLSFASLAAFVTVISEISMSQAR